jgi:hypothetical protein
VNAMGAFPLLDRQGFGGEAQARLAKLLSYGGPA